MAFENKNFVRVELLNSNVFNPPGMEILNVMTSKINISAIITRNHITQTFSHYDMY